MEKKIDIEEIYDLRNVERINIVDSYISRYVSYVKPRYVRCGFLWLRKKLVEGYYRMVKHGVEIYTKEELLNESDCYILDGDDVIIKPSIEIYFIKKKKPVKIYFDSVKDRDDYYLGNIRFRVPFKDCMLKIPTKV